MKRNILGDDKYVRPVETKAITVVKIRSYRNVE